MAYSSISSVKLGRARGLVGALFLSISALTVSAAQDPEKVLEGQAVVIDGDTLEIGGERVRLEGIDAPELAQTCTKPSGATWNCGEDAAQVLTALVDGRTVACDDVGKDKYGRTLGLCFAEASDLNAAMVRHGFAWAFVKYSAAYVPAEAEAKAARAGVWQGAALAPWDYRNKPQQDAAAAPSGCAIKGNISKTGHIYHLPSSPWYAKVKIEATRGERWFCSEADALAAGWRRAAGSQVH